MGAWVIYCMHTHTPHTHTRTHTHTHTHAHTHTHTHTHTINLTSSSVCLHCSKLIVIHVHVVLANKGLICVCILPQTHTTYSPAKIGPSREEEDLWPSELPALDTMGGKLIASLPVSFRLAVTSHLVGFTSDSLSSSDIFA